MSRYDPNSMTRVLNLEKYDFRERSSACSSDSEEDESVNGIFKTADGVTATKTASGKDKKEEERGGKPPRGLFGIKRLGISRRDRERDADAAAGSVMSDSDSKLRSSVETNSDETFMTFGTALTGDHVNALLKARQAYNNNVINDDGDDAENEGVEDYWKAIEPSTVIRDATVLTNIPKDEDEEIPITDRIADRGKAERRQTSNSMLTATFDDGNSDSSGHLEGDQDDIEDDLMKYAAAMVQKDSMPDSPGLEGAVEKRPLFKAPNSCCDVASIAATEKMGNTAGDDLIDDEEDDEEKGLNKNFVRRSSMEKLRHFFAGGGSTPAANSNETYDLRASCTVSTKKKKKKDKKSWSRRASDGTADSMWSWSQGGANILTRTSDGFNRRASNDSNRSHSGNYSNDDDDDDKSHTSGGTFDSSWLGLGNIAQKNGRGGASWRDARRMTLTPFVDYDGNSFHSQRSTPYRVGERTLKRCIGIMFVLAVVVLSGALIGINITSKDDTVGEPLIKTTPSSALTAEEKLVIAESVNAACSSTSVESSDGRHKCQQICHDHFCCFDNDQDGYNCQTDATKLCDAYAGCEVLVEDLVGSPDVEHVDSNTLTARVNNACNNVETSMGKLECHKACDDHMCCFEESSQNCRADAKKECLAYEACAVLQAGADNIDNDNANTVVNEETGSTVTDEPPTKVPLPSWDTEFETLDNANAAQKIDYFSDESDHDTVTIGETGQYGDSSETVSTIMPQIFIPNGDDAGSSSFVPLGAAAVSSEGISELEVDTACQNVLSNASDRNKCEKLCMNYMCCFESDEEKACFTNSDCSIYGSCVLLGSDTTFDSNLDLNDDTPTSVDDKYYDDDMLIVDTEEGDDDKYDETVFHIGNRTTLGLDQPIIMEVTSSKEQTSTEDDALFATLALEEDDDIYVVNTEEEEELDPYDATLYEIGQRSL